MPATPRRPCRPGPARVVRAIALPSAAHLGASALLAWGTASPFAEVAAPGPAGFDDLVAVTAAAAAWAALTWLTGCTLVAVAALGRGSAAVGPRSAAVVTAAMTAGSEGSAAAGSTPAIRPAIAQRLAALLLGVSLGLAPAATGSLPATAVATVASESGSGSPPISGSMSGSMAELPSLDRPSRPQTTPDLPATSQGRREALATWTPDRPAAPPRRARDRAVALVTSTPHREHAVVEETVVRRGDTLWEIAAAHLGPDASAADVAAAWPRWYAANRAAIGPDPGLIRPGQRLLPPPS